MKRNFLKLFIFIAFIATTQLSWAQHLTYSDFMLLTNKKLVSDIDETLSAKGYVLADSKNDEIVTIVAWTYNCTDFILDDDSSGFDWEWKTGSKYDVFYIKRVKENDNVLFSYHFNSKSVFNNLLKSVRNNGFKLIKDEIKKSNILRHYRKKNTNGVLILITNSNGGYSIEYYPNGFFEHPNTSQ